MYNKYDADQGTKWRRALVSLRGRDWESERERDVKRSRDNETEGYGVWLEKEQKSAQRRRKNFILLATECVVY